LGLGSDVRDGSNPALGRYPRQFRLAPITGTIVGREEMSGSSATASRRLTLVNWSSSPAPIGLTVHPIGSTRVPDQQVWPFLPGLPHAPPSAGIPLHHFGNWLGCSSVSLH